MMDGDTDVRGCKEGIKIEDLTSWQATTELGNSGSYSASTEENPNQLEGDETAVEEPLPQFPFSIQLNSKIYLYNGDITKLCIQAVILPVFEVLSRYSPLHTNLLHSAGRRFMVECRGLTTLRTSEICVNPGYDLPARYVVHAIEPRYNIKYHSAADTALHICYRSSLQTCAEKEFRTVAISPLHITRKGFPLKEGCHIALRTIRKCLEMLDSKFDAVVIVTDPVVVETYSKIFPVYFPRSDAESYVSARFLPKNIVFDEWGEVQQEERAIRISDISEIKPEIEETPRGQSSSVTESENSEDELVLDQKLVPRTFAQMSGDHDKKRQFMLQYNMTQQNIQAQDRIYQRLLRIARTQDFPQFSNLNAVKVSGYDVTGNRVIVIIGRQLNFSQMDPEKFLLYLILTFDPIISEPYTIVYFHTQTLDFNRPTTNYMRRLYNTCDQRYKTNLARLCFVHMSTLSKIRTWFFMTLSAGDIRDRIVNVRSIPELYKIVVPDQIDIPPFVLSYDMKENPQDYNTSPKNSPTNSVRLKSQSEFNRIAHGTL